MFPGEQTHAMHRLDTDTLDTLPDSNSGMKLSRSVGMRLLDRASIISLTYSFGQLRGCLFEVGVGAEDADEGGYDIYRVSRMFLESLLI